MKSKLACGVLLVAVAALPALAAESNVKLLYTPPFVMPMPAPSEAKTPPRKVVMPFPVVLGGDAQARDVVVEKVGVRYLNSLDTTLDARFEVELVPAASATAIPTLAISVSDPATLPPGEYQLMIHSSRRNADANAQVAEPPDLLVVPLTRAGVKLDTPGQVTVDQWLATPWHGTSSSVIPNVVEIRATEDTKMTPIAALQAQARPFTSGTPGVNVGSWTITPELPAKPGDPAKLPLKPEGFPVGIASGRIEVRGPDLVAPMTFDVEVRTRLYAVWIPIVVLVGVAFGWLLRVILQRRIDLATARKPGFDELQRSMRQIEHIADAEFWAAVGPSLKELRLALERDDAAAIAAATTTARTVVETAQTTLNGALKLATEQVNTLRADFDIQAALPATLGDVRISAEALAARASSALRSSDAGGVRKMLAEGDRRLGEQFADARPGVMAAIDAQLQALENLAPLLSAPQRERLAGAVKKRRDEYAAIPAPDRTKANELLKGIAQIGRELQAMRDWAGRALVEDAGQHLRLARGRVQNPGELDADGKLLHEQVGAAAQALHDHLKLDNGFAPPNWAAAADTAISTTHQLLQSVLKLRPDVTIAPDPENKRFFDEVIKDISTDDPTLHDDKNAIARESASAPGEEIVDAERGFSAVATGMDAPTVNISLGEVTVAAERNLGLLMRTELWMAAVVGVLLALVSFAFYQDRFVGTWPELLGLFFWGFSADLGADKVVTKVKELGVALKS
jgi:hypothetical protein